MKVDEEDTPLVQVEMFINMLVKKQMAAEKEAVRRVQEATKVEWEKEREVMMRGKQQLRDERTVWDWWKWLMGVEKCISREKRYSN